MAAPKEFVTYGAMQVRKGVSYSETDLPTGVTIDTVKISEAPKIWRKVFDQNGKQSKLGDAPVYAESNKRGVYIKIRHSGATYSEDYPNIPTLYFEGDEIKMHTSNTYTFLQDCIVEYGQKIV